MTTLIATTTIDQPAATVWAVLADYGCDPDWRDGVETMAPNPAGEVRVGTTTAEVMRLAGRVYRNAGVVTDVRPGECFSWRTTSGADAHGSRCVEPLGTHRCQVSLEIEVRLHGMERALQPVLMAMLRRTLRADLRRLGQLVARDAVAPLR
jgi:uncharacterized protein YndB with AHSA1/START domain